MCEYVTVQIPASCYKYPGGGKDRTETYQRLEHREGNIVYVALEAKIWKYHHKIHFGSFTIGSDPDFDIAYLQAFTSYDIDYEGPDETIIDETKIIEYFQVKAMIPYAKEVRVLSSMQWMSESEINVLTHDAFKGTSPPQDKFEYTFHGSGKRCYIDLAVKIDTDYDV